jgi:hypothetical protein
VLFCTNLTHSTEQIILEKLTVAELVNKLPGYLETLLFITVFITARISNYPEPLEIIPLENRLSAFTENKVCLGNTDFST